MPQIEAEFAQLNRDYEINKKNYEQLVQRRESANMGSEINNSVGVDFRLIDPPRVSPQAGRPEPHHVPAADAASCPGRRGRGDLRCQSGSAGVLRFALLAGSLQLCRFWEPCRCSPTTRRNVASAAT
jgi:hypothetical protein